MLWVVWGASCLIRHLVSGIRKDAPFSDNYCAIADILLNQNRLTSLNPLKTIYCTEG
ncbi:hypothetical protein Thi970DRAFT_00902 [Thiorhodovibrio frisius]|uniref:Uncharacterized protein n=1 Tax=Thiorhodovibrio frisius TaxID=631362 RepID=H8YXS0_9GAMM|nr:hypothetical protein Thi970DRAFT_00902 [Thiorhodovibrio frisius]WPL23678.1 hypothetical protein Thiofri_03878 [Thiorhodovibrio frisius]